jgi:hypothetical protein
MTPRYHIYVSARGNVFMTEIAALLAASLADLGHDTVFPAPGLPEPGTGRVNLVVAPHEFFPLHEGASERELLAAASTCITVGVEQPGTQWFDIGAHYASHGLAILDINTYAVTELRRRGLDAIHLQLGYHSSWDRWGGDGQRGRERDVLFLGSATDRRERYLGSFAEVLGDRSSDVRLFEFPRPMSEPRGLFVAGTEKWDLLASSKILLNVHRDEVPYFEWVRVLEAVTNGCLVVSEQSSDYGALIPGEHLVAAPPALLGTYAASLLVDNDLRVAMSVAAYEFIRTKLDFNQIMAGMCEYIERTVPVPRSHHAVPLPVPVMTGSESPPVPADLEAALETERQVWARVKNLLDSETEAVQRIEALESRLRFGDADYAEITATGAWDRTVPEVSVVITSFNYERFVVEAIESVVASQGALAELVIVDDHSQDHSVDAIKATMAATDWFPIMLLAKAANRGVGPARNAGFTQARTDRVLVLDADNLIFPTTLAQLSAALEAEPDSSAAYGVVAKIGEPGLVSYLPWDVEKLARGPYIDALSMIRRNAWQDLGGYEDFASLRGWEDYELWLKMAQDERQVAFIPSYTGLYRVHAENRSRIVFLDMAPLHATFRSRYPQLPWEDS